MTSSRARGLLPAVRSLHRASTLVVVAVSSTLILAGIAFAATPLENPRTEARKLLDALQARPDAKKLAAEPVGQAQRALDRAKQARSAADYHHADMLESLALEWAETARDLGRAAAAESQARKLQNAGRRRGKQGDPRAGAARGDHGAPRACTDAVGTTAEGRRSPRTPEAGQEGRRQEARSSSGRSQGRRKVKRLVPALGMALLLSCAASPRPQVMSQVDAVEHTPSAELAQKLAPQAFAHAEQLQRQSEQAYQDDDLSGAQILGEHALAAYTHSFVLARAGQGPEAGRGRPRRGWPRRTAICSRSIRRKSA